MSDDVQPFTVRVSEREVTDLRSRLDRTRWPDQLPGTTWELGTDVGFLRELCDHWADGFSFETWVERCNRYPQVRTEIDGVTVHAIVAGSTAPDATPLLLIHGWPGSVAEYFDVIEPLRAHHHVIVPSIPGYGFSGPTTRFDIGPRAIAGIFVELMRRLGHDRFVTAGGDWGAVIGAWMGAHHPDHVAAVHLTLLPIPAPSAEVRSQVTDSERELGTRSRRTMATGTGYQSIQATRPQSLAYGLTDSPAGLAGWIVEKFRSWSDCDGDITSVFTLDRLLENVSIYWFTGTINSSMRLYHEAMTRTPETVPDRPITASTGHPVYPGELFHTPRAWSESFYAITHWAEMPRGGHFAAMEVPEAYVADLLAFTSTVA
jgi:microsomal epoxide hydrolase